MGVRLRVGSAVGLRQRRRNGNAASRVDSLAQVSEASGRRGETTLLPRRGRARAGGSNGPAHRISPSYNLPSAIAFGSNSTTFNYNASHQRWKQDANYAGVHEVTYYIGGIMEKTTKGTGATEYRHLIPAGSGSAILTRRSDLTTNTYYTTSDHLGSGDLVLSSTATVLAHESFTPFGARRGANWQGIPTTADYTVFSNTSRRGFTGHEMLDSVSLIHMNGRVYDPTVGRFLSADPIIQTFARSQAINPFSYVMNMPLSLVDPSGYSWLSKLFSGIGHFLKQYGATILSVAFTLMGMPFIGMLLSSAFSAAVNGGNFLQNFAIGLAIGAVTGAIGGYAAGGIAKGLGINAGSIWGQVFRGALAGAVAGGLGAAAFGGNVWAGMVGGAVTGAVVGGIVGKYRAGLLAKAEHSGLVSYDDGAQQQAMRELSQSPEGQQFLIEALGHNVKVSITWAGTPTADSHYYSDSNSMEITLPKDMTAFRAAPNSDPSATLASVLAHETGHYYTGSSSVTTQATDENGEITGYTFSRNIALYRATEVGASGWENGFRLWSGMAPRATYGDFPVPRSTCLICIP